MLAFDAALFGSITLRTDHRMLREKGGAKVANGVRFGVCLWIQQVILFGLSYSLRPWGLKLSRGRR